MRVLVTILASFILALGILGAGLTLLHTIPRKQKVTDPGLEIVKPADLDVRPEPIAPRTRPGGPREASFRKDVRGELRLEGRIQFSGNKPIGIKLLRVDDKVGLFLRRANLGSEREFHFEGLTPGTYELQIHENPTGQILAETVVRVPSKKQLVLDLDSAGKRHSLRFSPQVGTLEPGAILVLENDGFFYERVTGKAEGRFVTRGLPTGQMRYTIRGRLSPTTASLVWKGEIAILPAAQSGEALPLEIKLGAPEKDPID